jgi:ABC-type uncharacterized transport system substrate-binding protein
MSTSYSRDLAVNGNTGGSTPSRLLDSPADFACDKKRSSVSLSVFRKWLLCIISIVSVFFLYTSAYAKESNVLIILSSNDDVYLDVATTITNSTIKMCRNWSLSCQDANFEISQITTLDQEFTHDHKVIVTLGIKAAHYAKQYLRDELVISALIPRNSNIDAGSDQNTPNHHYLYLDQPIHRSLLLISALSDRFKNIGVILSKNDVSTEKALTRSVSRLELSLHLERIEETDQNGASLNHLLQKSDVLLAIPDTKIHNRSTVSNILISSYRKRIPLIGFSSAYVKAGALAAVYSSPEDIAFHVRDNIVKIYSDEKIKAREQNAEYFSILFNSGVARSLDFPAKSEYELENKMLKKAINSHD